MSIGDFLIGKYGPLMTLNELAQVLKRSEDGLRVCLTKNDPFYRAIADARLHLGRRLYFSTPAIGAILENKRDPAQ